MMIIGSRVSRDARPPNSFGPERTRDRRMHLPPRPRPLLPPAAMLTVSAKSSPSVPDGRPLSSRWSRSWAGRRSVRTPPTCRRWSEKAPPRGPLHGPAGGGDHGGGRTRHGLLGHRRTAARGTALCSLLGGARREFRCYARDSLWLPPVKTTRQSDGRRRGAVRRLRLWVFVGRLIRVRSWARSSGERDVLSVKFCQLVRPL